MERLRAAEVAFTAVPDLCELSARRDPLLRKLAEGGPLRIAACFPRAVKWLFNAAGAPLVPDTTQVVNVRTETPETAVRALLATELSANLPCAQAAVGAVARSPATGVGEAGGARTESASGLAPAAERASGGDDWQPWFPVIDYDRCTNCRQCLGFCLFGVYGVDGSGWVEVQSPDRCKTLCPACARVCPQGAILFPKHASGPINGDEAGDREAVRPPLSVDVSALLSGDVHALLRDRSARARRRFSPERDPDRAFEERCRCLQELSVLAEGIPPEVLRSLPGPEEMARRAEEAAARVKAAGPKADA